MSNIKNLVGSLANLVEFGEVKYWQGETPEELKSFKLEKVNDSYWIPKTSDDGFSHLGVEWEEPRKIYSIKVRYKDPVDPNKISVQYWQYNWPTILPERLKGARRGWIGVDDPFHGRWVTANVDVKINENEHLYTFDPLDITEIPNVEQLEEAEDINASFRKTLKFRLLFKSIIPYISDIEAYSSSRWQRLKLNVWFKEVQDISVKIYNGKLLEAKEVKDKKLVSIDLLYMDCKDNISDRTIVTILSQKRSFSFSINDLLREKIIYIKDYEAFVTLEDIEVNNNFIERFLVERMKSKSIYDRVFDEPEQTYERAMREVPPLQKTKQYPPYGRYIILGCENNRKKFAIRFNGDIFINKQLLKLRGRDTSKLIYPGVELMYKFGTGDPPDFREREDGSSQSLMEGYLPIISTKWLDREIEYEEITFTTYLDGDIENSLFKRGDETTVCIVRFNIRNTTEGKKEAQLWLLTEPGEAIALENGLISAIGKIVPAETVKDQWKIQRYDSPVLRYYIKRPERGELTLTPYPNKIEKSYSIPRAVLYKVPLDSYERVSLELYIPFDNLLTEKEKDKLLSISYEEALNKVKEYWKGFIESGGKIVTPNPLINDFFKAVAIHIAINGNKDPYSDNIVLPAGTLAYGPCGNEACLQIRQLDYRGYHERAERLLNIFLYTQGSKKLDGNFKTREGGLQGCEVYKGEIIDAGFKYNLDHGFILTMFAEHYLLTRDRTWLEKVLPNLISACDFIIRERKTTMLLDEKGEKVKEFGLLPAGHLEDNPEWRHWFAVNAHAWKGMNLVADILKEIEHPEAERIGKEVEAYREDILNAVERAMIESPVVKLLDDTFIPHIPTRTGIRGRELGWFREGAYGPLHLADCGVIDARDEKTTWILKDLEDNIFISREYGRPVDLERYWFSHGGVTIQANLLNNALVYLRRDEVKHAVRSFYNNFACSIYPDVRVFTEHPVVELGHGVGPFYKTPDESGFLNWLRNFLIMEDGTRLLLAMGTPREWLKEGNIILVKDMATYFGPVSYQIESKVDSEKKINIWLSPPRRNPPEETVIRLRHPREEKIKRVILNEEEYKNYDSIKEEIYIDRKEKVNVVVEYQ